MKSALLALAACLLLLAACDISEPHMPQWNMDLTIPLVNENFYVSDIADSLTDSLSIVVGDGGVITFTGEGSAESNPFGDVNYEPDIDVSGITLNSGIVYDGTLPLADPTGTVALSAGKFKQGGLTAHFTDVNPGVTDITISFPDIRNEAGEPFTVHYDGTPGSQYETLHDFHIGTYDSGQILEQLNFHVQILSNQPFGTPVASLGFSLNERFGFRYFQGRLVNYRRDYLDEIQDVQVEYPDFIESALLLQEANLYVELTNEVGFSGEFHGELYAKNDRTGEEVTLNVVDPDGNFYVAQAAASQEQPTVTTFNFSNNLTSLLQIMPNTVRLQNAYLLINSGSGEIGTVNELNKLYADYRLEAPLRVIILEHEIAQSEPMLIDSITESNRELIRDNILSAELVARVADHVPVGGTATIYFGPGAGIDPAQPGSYSYQKSFSILSSQAGGEAEQVIRLALSKSELDLFSESETVYLRWLFHFDPSDGVVEISGGPESFVSVKAMLQAKVHVEE